MSFWLRMGAILCLLSTPKLFFSQALPDLSGPRFREIVGYLYNGDYLSASTRLEDMRQSYERSGADFQAARMSQLLDLLNGLRPLLGQPALQFPDGWRCLGESLPQSGKLQVFLHPSQAFVTVLVLDSSDGKVFSLVRHLRGILKRNGYRFREQKMIVHEGYELHYFSDEQPSRHSAFLAWRETDRNFIVFTDNYPIAFPSSESASPSLHGGAGGPIPGGSFDSSLTAVLVFLGVGCMALAVLILWRIRRGRITSTYWLRQSGTEIQWPLGKVAVVLGRDRDCGIRIDDPAVSRRQASIEWKNGFYFLINLSTTNPVLLNGRPIVRSVLSSGDRVRIVGYEFEFLIVPE